MDTKRATVLARAHDLDVLQEEARRRGVSLSSLMRRAVAHEAAALRRVRGPGYGARERPAPGDAGRSS
jgi:hypothetical protein